MSTRNTDINLADVALSDGAEDRERVARITRGDSHALEEVFLEYGVRLCAYAHRCTGSREVAEELVNDVFLAIWINRERLEIATSLKTYLFGATRNRVLNFLRSGGVQKRFEAGAVDGTIDPLIRTPEHAGEAVQRADLREAIRRAIEALPDRTREIFLLNREQELTYAEIASLIGISGKTVEYHMGRAFAHLRSRLAAWAPSVS